MSRKRRSIAVVAGSAAVGLAIPIVYAIVGATTRGSGSRETMLRLFFWFSAPAFGVAEAVFGQAPIPIFAALACYWLLLGLSTGLLVLLALGVKRGVSGVVVAPTQRSGGER